MTNNNVYHEVTFFFSGDLEYLPLDIDQDLIEGFLRQKAWQGLQDADLQDIWNNLKMYLSYLSYSGSLDIEEITHSEYSLIVEWISVQADFNPTLATTRRFFAVLEDFYNYLLTKRLISEEAFGQLKRAKEIMTGGKKLQFIEPDYDFNPFEKMDDDGMGQVTQIMPENISKMIGEAVERLMLKFSSYFQQDKFIEDFDRALILYSGPFANESDGEGGKKESEDEFWLGFWDYFLFDYHLLENDLTPLAKFNNTYKNKVSPEEKRILSDLLAARFTVFYVSDIINPDWVQCVNLFTDEKFRLPNPNFDYKVMKKMLFFGHVFLQQEGREFVMINFITSVEVSPNLRKRIKEETERQKTIFNIQNPPADWNDFLARHANIVRHTIDLLVSSAKVIVTPYTHLEQKFPVIPDLKESFEQSSQYKTFLEVNSLIEKSMPNFAYSYHDIVLAKKLWCDYCYLSGVELNRLRSIATWAAAVIYAYFLINAGDEFLTLDTLSENMGVKKSSVNQNQIKISECLQLMRFDPRYLSEEGFLYLLYQ